MADLSSQISEIFKKLGMKMKHQVHGERTYTDIYGVLQPLLYKNKMYVEMQPSAMGPVDDGCYLYLGPVTPKFRAEDFLIAKTKKYVVQRYERVYFCSKPIYSWAIVRPSNVESSIGEED